MSAPLGEVDPEIAELLGKELGRQRDTLEMIASENFAPRSVLQAQGSILTNKYAEGLPGRRVLGADVAGSGVSVVTGGTDVHLVLVDLRNSPLDGKAAEDLLPDIGITVNRNAVPDDPRPPMVTSDVSIGTSALATRGFGEAEFTEVAEIIGTALAHGGSADVVALRDRVARLARVFPLYDGLERWELHPGR